MEARLVAVESHMSALNSRLTQIERRFWILVLLTATAGKVPWDVLLKAIGMM